jgi:hypothetical protein
MAPKKRKMDASADGTVAMQRLKSGENENKPANFGSDPISVEDEPAGVENKSANAGDGRLHTNIDLLNERKTFSSLHLLIPIKLGHDLVVVSMGKSEKTIRRKPLTCI